MIISKKTILFAIFFLLIIASCRSDKKPTEPSLTGPTWRLKKIETGTSSEKLIDRPKNYTIRFYDDGKFKVKSDCNKCSGNYTVASKFIKLSELDCSKQFCGKASFDYLYKKYLSESSSYILSRNGLVLKSFKGNLVLSEK